jgi:hypothetical protein
MPEGGDKGVSNLDMSLLLILLLRVAYTAAHVALTYPPALYPQYDFLDNVRTGAPCGLSMGQYSQSVCARMELQW